MSPGEIYLHRRFYADPESGELRDKFFIVLAMTPGRDLVIRLLTSRQNDRPVDPPCFHGDPYPGFFLGTPGGHLNRATWVDLRYLDDADPIDARRGMERGYLVLVGTLEPGRLRSVLDCAANAIDTTRLQEKAMRDQIAKLPA